MRVTLPGRSSALVSADKRVAGRGVNWGMFDWIWHIKGRVALEPGQSSDEVFDRLDPLFRMSGTSHSRTSDMLTFRKKDQAAQDKMSIFDGGDLRVEHGAAGSMLSYRLTSRALLFCFLAPLLFLAFAQLTIVLGNLEPAKTANAEKKADKVLPQHPIDKAMGAPAPEKKKKDPNAEKAPPTAAYVFAALFALLYVAGRALESRLVNRLFKKLLKQD